MAKQTTSSDVTATARTMSDNDRQILTKAFTMLHGVLKDYWVGEAPLPSDLNLNSAKMCHAVAARALNALDVIREEEKKARYAALRLKITETTKPLIDAAQATRKAMEDARAMISDKLADNPTARDAALKGMTVPDSTRIALALLVPAFPTGTTFEQIKETCEKLGYKVAKGADRGTFDLLIPLVVKDGPKPVPNAALAPRGEKEDSAAE